MDRINEKSKELIGIFLKVPAEHVGLLRKRILQATQGDDIPALFVEVVKSYLLSGNYTLHHQHSDICSYVFKRCISQRTMKANPVMHTLGLGEVATEYGGAGWGIFLMVLVLLPFLPDANQILSKDFL